MAMTTSPATMAPRTSDDVWYIRSKKCMACDTPHPASTAMKMANPPTVGVGRGWTFRSEGRSMAPDTRAALRTSGVAANEVTAATPNTTRYEIIRSLPPGAMAARLPSIFPYGRGPAGGAHGNDFPQVRRRNRRPGRPRASSGVGGETGGQPSHPFAGSVLHGVVIPGPQHLAHDARDLFHLGLVHAQRGRAGSPHPDARGRHRRQRVERDGVLVDGDADLVARRLGLGSGDVERP